jgi:hypothetical protein
MNDKDVKYFQFITSLSEEQFSLWYEGISDDEADYALEIMQKARAAIGVKIAEIFDVEEATTNLSAAKGLIEKFTLKGMK